MNMGKFLLSTGESLEDALRQLYLIDAIDENGQITETGRIMAGIGLIFLSFELFSTVAESVIGYPFIMNKLLQNE